MSIQTNMSSSKTNHASFATQTKFSTQEKFPNCAKLKGSLPKTVFIFSRNQRRKMVWARKSCLNFFFRYIRKKSFRPQTSRQRQVAHPCNQFGASPNDSRSYSPKSGTMLHDRIFPFKMLIGEKNLAHLKFRFGQGTFVVRQVSFTLLLNLIVATVILLSTRGTAGSDIWYTHLVGRPVVRSYHPRDYA